MLIDPFSEKDNASVRKQMELSDWNLDNIIIWVL